MPYRQLQSSPLFENDSQNREDQSSMVPQESFPKRKSSSRSNNSRDEMNLAEFPLTILSTRADSKIKTLEFTDNHQLNTGERIERKWIITGADKFGLPTATDDDVILGLMRLTMDNDFRSRKVYFTRYELLKVLRWSTEGRSYTRLTKSLDRLSGVRIRATNSFFDNSLKAYQTKNFGVIDAYEINDSRANKNEAGEQPKSFFIWSEVLFDSFKAGNIKKLDLDLYFGLKSSISRRLYRYLDKHFYYRYSIEKNVLELAFEKLGLSRNYKYVSSVKQQIEPAAEELVQVGFLKGFQFEGRGSQTSVRFHSSRAAGVAFSGATRIGEKGKTEESSQTPKEQNRRNQYIEALASRGINITQAKRLIQNKTEDEVTQIEDILRYYDYLVETKDHKVSKNRVGFLYKAVEQPFKFVVPPQFQSGKQTIVGGKFPPSTNQARPRPEHKIFRAKPKPPSPLEELKAEESDSKKLVYQQFVESKISRQLDQMNPTELARICHVVEERLKGLQTVLNKDRYEQVLESCVRDEVKKTCEIATFEQWIRE